MKKTSHMRPAFSMITAIFILVLVATVAVFILNLSGKMVKETTTQYQREQAMLLARSYTEYALMAVTANEENSSHCLDNIEGSYGDYTIDVNISYLGTDQYLGTGSGSSCSRILANDINTSDTPLSVLIDVYVHFPDYEHPDDMNLTYHRRTLQKI